MNTLQNLLLLSLLAFCAPALAVKTPPPLNPYKTIT